MLRAALIISACTYTLAKAKGAESAEKVVADYLPLLHGAVRFSSRPGSPHAQPQLTPPQPRSPRQRLRDDVLDSSDFWLVPVFDEDARAGMKVFSAWPTFPQLYVRGAFVGGLDVMREMHEGGELAPLLRGLGSGAPLAE
jgi:hypothetical protein